MAGQFGRAAPLLRLGALRLSHRPSSPLATTRPHPAFPCPLTRLTTWDIFLGDRLSLHPYHYEAISACSTSTTGPVRRSVTDHNISYTELDAAGHWWLYIRALPSEHLPLLPVRLGLEMYVKLRLHTSYPRPPFRPSFWPILYHITVIVPSTYTSTTPRPLPCRYQPYRHVNQRARGAVGPYMACYPDFAPS